MKKTRNARWAWNAAYAAFLFLALAATTAASVAPENEGEMMARARLLHARQYARLAATDRAWIAEQARTLSLGTRNEEELRSQLVGRSRNEAVDPDALIFHSLCLALPLVDREIDRLRSEIACSGRQQAADGASKDPAAASGPETYRSIRLQSFLDRRSKMAHTVSSMLSKLEEAEKGVSQNMK